MDVQKFLNFAARAGRLDEVKSAIAQGADINMADANGDMPAEHSLRNGHLEAAVFMLQRGARVRNLEFVHYFVFRYALKARPEFADVLKRLPIEHEIDEILRPPITIHEAVQNDDRLRVETMIKENPGLLNSPDANGHSPLHLTADWNRVEIAGLLLAAGANANAIDSDDYCCTPLYLAAMRGRTEICSMLINSGANVEARIVDYGWTPLHAAARSGFVDVVEILLKAGADVNSIDHDHGCSPLLLAAQAGKKQVVAVLLAGGANPEIRDGLGRRYDEAG